MNSTEEKNIKILLESFERITESVENLYNEVCDTKLFTFEDIKRACENSEMSLKTWTKIEAELKSMLV